MTSIIFKLGDRKFRWTDIIPYTVPAWMWTVGGLSIPWTLALWMGTILSSGFFFVVYGLTAGHHSYTNFFEGDIPRYLLLINNDRIEQ